TISRSISLISQGSVVAWELLRSLSIIVAFLFAAVAGIAAPGDTNWTINLGSTITAAPVRGPDGTIYYPTADGYLNAVRPQGNVLWRRQFAGAGEVCSAPDGALYFSAT